MECIVSIVILNWNGGKHVYRCIENVIAQAYKTIEVIIVDNGSTDGSIEEIQKKYPQFTYITNSYNRGFAAGMNQGIEISSGEYVIPLNQDVCLHREFVNACTERISCDEGIGAIGGNVYAWRGDELTNIPRVGDGGVFYLRKRFQGFGGIHSDRERLSFAPAGSFPFLRKKMLDDLFNVSGYYYDEQFVTGWEDMDLFFRMNLRGWTCLFLPTAYGWHVGSGSIGGNSTFISKDIDYQIRILRNRYFTMIKNIPSEIWVWLLPYLMITELTIPFYFLIRSPKSLLALAKAWAQVFIQLPALMKERESIQKNISVPEGYLKQFFIAF